jgi:hypothetical protein
MVEQLRQVRDLAQFLRSKHGLPKPADEDDEWSDEDRRDFSAAARKRLGEEGPYPWEDEPDAPAR